MYSAPAVEGVSGSPDSEAEAFITRASLAPCSAARGCPRRPRSLLIWEEGSGQPLVVEAVCSRHRSEVRWMVRAAGGRIVVEKPLDNAVRVVEGLLARGERLVVPPPHDGSGGGADRDDSVVALAARVASVPTLVVFRLARRAMLVGVFAGAAVAVARATGTDAHGPLAIVCGALALLVAFWATSRMGILFR